MQPERRSGDAGGPAVEVRPLKEGELQRALPLFAGYQRFYGVEHPDDERNLEFFGRFIEPSEDGVLLGAFVDGDVVGFACLYWTFSSVSAAEIALMNDLFVAPGHRGTGVGRVLIDAAAAFARRRGCHHLEWFTAIDNDTAQRLYDRTGAERSAWYAYEIPLR
jgi:GNAT superfamily N-acetyltransferase